MAMPNVDYVDYKGTRYKYAGKALKTKAEIDGYYESMAVGLSDNLNSNILEEDQMPYLFRTAGGSMNIGTYEKMKAIVGGTVEWNQLVPANYKSQTTTPNGTATYSFTNVSFSIQANHIYAVGCNITYNGTLNPLRLYIQIGSVYGKPSIDATSANKRADWLIKPTANNTTLNVGVSNITTSAKLTAADAWSYDNLTAIDLTSLFGPTIADYIYALETGSAGAGVAFFKKLFPKPYYAYNAGELISVKTSAHITTGFNQWNEQWEVGGFYTGSGLPWATTDRIRSKNYIPVLPNATYYIKVPNGSNTTVLFYDSNYNFIEGSAVAKYNTTFITPANAAFMKFNTGSVYGTTYKNDICINLHWDGERDGEYEPYVQHTYPLDDVELRGIFKLDANNKLYCDGDMYEPDGTVTRKYGIVDLGTLTWTFLNSEARIFQATIVGMYSPTTAAERLKGIVSSKYPVDTVTTIDTGMTDKTMKRYNGRICIKDTLYSDAATFKTAMSGVYLVYELATPTTETADPYTEVQVVDDWGTEEFVDERAVPIPVGHLTQYPANLKAKVEVAPESPDGDGDYVLRQTSGQNAYVPLEQVKELPDYPAGDGEYTLKVTVTGGVATLSWE